MDGGFLEIIAKTEVAQHFKKGMMAGRIANVFKIIVLAPGPNTALGSRRPLVVPVFMAQKQVLELHHSRIGEQQRRIVPRHQ